MNRKKIDLFESKISEQNKVLVLNLGLAFVAGIGLLDYLIKYEISLSLFYLIPIILVSWFFSLSTGIVFSILCIGAIAFTDFLSQFTYSSAIVYIWNNIAIMVIYFIIAILISKLKSTLLIRKELSTTDPITGISNYRTFLEVAPRELARSLRYKHPLTIVYIDCDNFKDINDTYGHSSGDQLLILIAETIKNNIRSSDFAFRVGGDEFVILLPETGAEDSKEQIIRINEKLKEALSRDNWAVTLSIGIATFVKPPDSVDDMLKKADSLMYRVKQQGKKNIIQNSYE